MPAPIYLSTSDLAWIFGVSRQCIFKWEARGDFPAHHHENPKCSPEQGRWWDSEAIDRYIDGLAAEAERELAEACA